ncbi:MAG: MFS transporter [Firmicutes bacterium]|nr:MFS transporter [Bacillota bacterium]
MKTGQNFRKFMLLWAGELISQIGGGLSSFGLGVYIFHQTGRAADMALITLLGFLPGLLLSVPAGVLADRYDRRLLMMVGDGCSGLGIVFILVCMMNGGATLTQIAAGVCVSSVFSSLLEPSYKATITDLLTKEEYSKANGLVSLAGSAKYLFSPIIAGFLLSISDIKLLLQIDIGTFFFTVLCTAVVRKGIAARKAEATAEPFLQRLKAGWQAVHDRPGVCRLVWIASAVTLFMGVFQVLAAPLVLSFADAKLLGIAETICACGMLASGIVLGIWGIKGHFIRVLSISLALAGIAMFGFAMFARILPMCVFGFLFFATLPFANNCLDYLTRVHIPDDFQGRAWGLIGFLSQLGYVAAYSISGVAADALGRLTGRGAGGGSAMMILFSGVCLAIIALRIPMGKALRDLEKEA